MVDRDGYGWNGRSSYDVYCRIVDAGSFSGVESPLKSDANYQAVMDRCERDDIDWIVDIAWLWEEGHCGTDPGLVAASVNNLGGIMWVGQEGAYDSGIPSDTGGTYAGFYDIGGFIDEMHATLTNVYCGLYFDDADLQRTANTYVNGPQYADRDTNAYGYPILRADQWRDWRTQVDSEGGDTVSVTVDELISMAQTQIGHPRSGDYDLRNGYDHPWAYYCEAFVEATHENCGLPRVPQTTAIAAAGYYDLQQGRAPLGAAVFFGTSFYYPDGHTALSMGDGRCLGTLTDGTGVGYKNWNEQTGGYLGWAYYDGVVVGEPDPPPENWLCQPDNPYQDGVPYEIGIGGGFLRYYNSLGVDPMVVLGYAKDRECDATVTDDDGTSQQRTVQQFQRGTLIYQPENAFPYDVVMALATSTVTPV